ncbi:LuxR C-terminal-related transcriptional regulator [Streptomyces shenzhenensis]|uniref:helix-turn-helix transcriptional regulator n=1 Tax=Streptomyces shenzhenensis TaxID=943815 RepID=UPI0033ED250C
MSSVGSSMRKTIAIFDSTPVFIHGMTELLTSVGYLVPVAHTRLPLPGDMPTECLILDAEIDSRDAVERFIQAVQPESSILLVTGLASPNYCPEGISGHNMIAVARRAPESVFLETLTRLMRTTEATTPPNLGRPALGSISARERQVLLQIALGRTQLQIARSLGISHHTVDTHVKRIKKKIGAYNKADLTRAAFQLAGPGLVTAAGTVTCAPPTG